MKVKDAISRLNNTLTSLDIESRTYTWGSEDRKACERERTETRKAIVTLQTMDPDAEV